MVGSKEAREANKKASEDAAKEWEQTSKLIGDTLADYIMGGGKDAASYLKRLFATLVLRPVVEWGVSGLLGAAGLGGCSGGSGILGLASNANSAYNLFSGAGGNMGDLALPPYMEARPRKGGGYSYRVKLDDGSKVNLGWNLQDALSEYHRLRGRFDAQDQVASEIWTRHKKGAATRRLAFELSVEDVQQMLDRQAYRCAVTQRPFSNKMPTGQKIRPWAASIDRKNPNLGYTRENCRLVCASVNIALNRFGDQVFTELLEAMVRRVVRSELESLGITGYSHRGNINEKALQP